MTLKVRLQRSCNWPAEWTKQHNSQPIWIRGLDSIRINSLITSLGFEYPIDDCQISGIENPSLPAQSF